MAPRWGISWPTSASAWRPGTSTRQSASGQPAGYAATSTSGVLTTANPTSRGRAGQSRWGRGDLAARWRAATGSPGLPRSAAMWIVAWASPWAGAWGWAVLAWGVEGWAWGAEGLAWGAEGWVWEAEGWAM